MFSGIGGLAKKAAESALGMPVLASKVAHVEAVLGQATKAVSETRASVVTAVDSVTGTVSGAVDGVKAGWEAGILPDGVREKLVASITESFAMAPSEELLAHLDKRGFVRTESAATVWWSADGRAAAVPWRLSSLEGALIARLVMDPDRPVLLHLEVELPAQGIRLERTIEGTADFPVPGAAVPLGGLGALGLFVEASLQQGLVEERAVPGPCAAGGSTEEPAPAPAAAGAGEAPAAPPLIVDATSTTPIIVNAAVYGCLFHFTHPKPPQRVMAVQLWPPQPPRAVTASVKSATAAAAALRGVTSKLKLPFLGAASGGAASGGAAALPEPPAAAAAPKSLS